MLLHSKVGDPAGIQEAAGVWLHCPSNSSAAGFETAVELYLLHVLVPLGRTEEARELITGEIGSSMFTKEQRQAALEVVEERERQNQDPLNPEMSGSSDITERPISSQGLAL